MRITSPITSPRQLAALRQARQCAQLDIEFGAFGRGNWPLYLFRYAVWALAEGGEARVHAPGTLASTGIEPFRWTFRMILQVAAKAAHPQGVIQQVDYERQTFVIRRTAPASSRQPWSAIVMFSGNPSELPALKRCVESLAQQPAVRDGGQVIVCGPSGAETAARALAGIDYIPFDDDQYAGRILIARKKNHAIAAARCDNVLVCHTRMALHPDTLGQLPEDFDCITPRVEFHTPAGHRLPYLDLGFIRIASTSPYTTSTRPRLHFDRSRWRDFLSSYYAYVDGGLFCVKRSVALQTPLHDALAWGEGEDVEWCLRLLHAGRLVELAEQASAESHVNRLPRYIKFGHLALFRQLSGWANRAKHARSALRSLWGGR